MTTSVATIAQGQTDKSTAVIPHMSSTTKQTRTSQTNTFIQNGYILPKDRTAVMYKEFGEETEPQTFLLVDGLC